jgi:hypothetical protein
MGTFANLWAKHPSLQAEPVINPCSNARGSPHYANQCVIRLGVAMTGAGIDFSSFTGAYCYYGHGRRHPLRVEEFKLWINSDKATFAPYYAEVSKRDSRGRQRSYHSYLGRQGIVAFLDFWGGGTGDHIDLWNGERIAQGENYYFTDSRELWFWPIP